MLQSIFDTKNALLLCYTFLEQKNEEAIFMLEVKKVELKDKANWFAVDPHISEEEFEHKVSTQTGYVIWKDNVPIGVFRYNLFWDSIPFVTLIYLKEEQRAIGIGKEVMLFWENEMKAKGHKVVMTSTQVDESAQHFYRKIGYKDCGCLVLDIPELEQPMEMFLIKQL